jgi:hypothetical protein
MTSRIRGRSTSLSPLAVVYPFPLPMNNPHTNSSLGRSLRTLHGGQILTSTVSPSPSARARYPPHPTEAAPVLVRLSRPPLPQILQEQAPHSSPEQRRSQRH